MSVRVRRNGPVEQNLHVRYAYPSRDRYIQNETLERVSTPVFFFARWAEGSQRDGGWRLL